MRPSLSSITASTPLRTPGLWVMSRTAGRGCRVAILLMTAWSASRSRWLVGSSRMRMAGSVDHGSGDGKALTLATREKHSFIADVGVQSVW